ncbi:MAG: hypothetical protein B0W54_15045 [Cellvibrio sp. 79]|nr:MAG: hypothetical protein B0W54_15045 [Cellvibrio sp. 79]
MLDCLVIGGGHCGLLSGFFLGEENLNYLIVDSEERIGDVWRKRPDNLRLFTSRQFCGLADLPLSGDPEGYASGHEFADYLAHFAAQKNLNFTVKTRIVALRKDKDIFVAVTDSGHIYRARTVINATGSNQRAIIPVVAQQLDDNIQQLTGASYRNPQQLPSMAKVLVCGDGASGRQIAVELAANQCNVSLAHGRARKMVPNRVLGHDLFWWLHRIGVLYADRNSLIAKILRKRDPVPVAATASNSALVQRGITLRARAISAQGNVIQFEDGASASFDAVIWCAGYDETIDWLHFSELGNAKELASGKGKTPVKGLFVVGRKWLSCRASELVLGAERDVLQAVRYVLQECAAPLVSVQEGYQPL